MQAGAGMEKDGSRHRKHTSGPGAGFLVCTVWALAGPALALVADSLGLGPWVWAALLLWAGLLLGGMHRLWSRVIGERELLQQAMQGIAQGDLSQRGAVEAAASQEGAGAVQTPKALLGGMVTSLSGMVADVRSNAALVAQAGQQLVNEHQALSDRTELQATNLAQTVVSVEQLSSAVHQIDEITQHNAQMVGHALDQARALQQRAQMLSGAVSRFRLQQGTAEEAVALVESALGLARRGVATEALLAAVNDPGQPFHDRDMYVFALAADGSYRAFGGNPARVGVRVQELPGVRGEQLLADIIAQAERGPGWVEYDFRNPATQQVQTKMSFVCKHGGLYWGCGVYKSLALAA